MGRKKLVLKKIENPSARQVTFMKRKDGIMKKATELAILCGGEVGMIVFSPKGLLITFACGAGRIRIEDIFLRWIVQTDESSGQGTVYNGVCLSEQLQHLKYEQEMLGKLDKMEALEANIYRIKQRILTAEEKLRIYDPDVSKINTVHEAQEYQQHLSDAIRRIGLLKVKLIISLEDPNCNQVSPQHTQLLPNNPENFQASPTSEGLNNAGTTRNLLGGEEQRGETALPGGSYLKMSYLKGKAAVAGEGSSSWYDAN